MNELMSSPDRDPAMSPLENRKRRPLGSLSSLVNTLESSVMSRISKSVSLMARFPDFLKNSLNDVPIFDRHDDTDNDDENDSTLNDEDFLNSPTMKSKPPAVIRRTQSLFTDVTQVDIQLQSNDYLSTSGISTFTVSNDPIPRINESELKNIIEGVHSKVYDEYIVIDSRFPYEFEGGHIINAVNIALQSDLEERFVVNQDMTSNKRRLLIFHCEYSIFRGPTMANHLRKIDRIYNSDRYPYLLYPDIVVLEGGYKRFFDKYKEHCFPQSYVEMKDTKHKRTCEVEMSKVLQASKLTRAKSFNQFQPRLSVSHARSSSFTALLSSSDQNLSLGASTPSLRKSRSSKIHKKERRDLRSQFTQSLLVLPTSSDISKLDSPVSSTFEDDFAPPPTLFRNHSKSLSSLLLSVHSSLLLVCSESFSAFSSSDSLLETYSPFADCYEYFDSVSTNNSGNLLSGGTKSTTGYAFPANGHQFHSGNNTPFTQNSNQASKNKARLSWGRTNRLGQQFLSSPTISSPLTGITAATFESAHSNNTLMDVINDSEVEFSLPTRHSSRKSLFSFVNGQRNGNTLDIDEADEESD